MNTEKEDARMIRGRKQIQGQALENADGDFSRPAGTKTDGTGTGGNAAKSAELAPSDLQAQHEAMARAAESVNAAHRGETVEKPADDRPLSGVQRRPKPEGGE